MGGGGSKKTKKNQNVLLVTEEEKSIHDIEYLHKKSFFLYFYLHMNSHR